MASYNHFYDGAVDVRPSLVERVVTYPVTKFTAWAGPKLRKTGAFLFRELVRGAVAFAFLGFALVAVIYGAFYFIDFLVELLDTWLPRWGALAITSAVLLVPAGVAAIIGAWQLAKMQTVRTGIALTVRAGALLRAPARGKGGKAEQPW